MRISARKAARRIRGSQEVRRAGRSVDRVAAPVGSRIAPARVAPAREARASAARVPGRRRLERLGGALREHRGGYGASGSESDLDEENIGDESLRRRNE